jgi:hypothetical protein
MTNYQRTAAWLAACGKDKTSKNLSVQIGCHIEESIEFLENIELDPNGMDDCRLVVAIELLSQVGANIKSGREMACIPYNLREKVLDALCDMEVTGNGVAYLMDTDKDGADQAVLASNEAKLVDGKPVILEGGKIGKPPGWAAPDLSPFVAP